MMLITAPITNPNTSSSVSATVSASSHNARNAGRKKTNPVWDYFTDLKSRGLPGVRCRYCEWITNDRSPTTLKFHLKRKHDTGSGGIWSIVEERINLHTPQYKAARAAAAAANHPPVVENTGTGVSTRTHGNHKEDSGRPFSAMGARAVFEATPSSSQQRVLDQLIMSATSQSSVTAPSFDNENKCYESENASRSSPRTPSCAANDGRESGADGAYQLSDGQNIAELLQVAADMDLTFTFNSRSACRTGEYCFESNLPTMKGKMVVFSDLGDKISITERHDGVDQSGEEWKKADWKQFLWAVRGKCMNALKGI